MSSKQKKSNSGLVRRSVSEGGFTLIELMVVIFIIGILSAVTFSILRGRVDVAKWSEARSAAGSIRTAARALIAEKGNAYNFTQHNGFLNVVGPGLGFDVADLDGKYFNQNDYQIQFTNNPPNSPTYVITVTTDASQRPEAPTEPASVQLDDTGIFTDL